jgi:hypothetical protein
MRSLSLALIVTLLVGPCVIATPMPPRKNQLPVASGSGSASRGRGQQNPPAGLSLPSEGALGNPDASGQDQGGQDTSGAPGDSNPSRRKTQPTEQMPEGGQGHLILPVKKERGRSALLHRRAKRAPSIVPKRLIPPCCLVLLM